MNRFPSEGPNRRRLLATVPALLERVMPTPLLLGETLSRAVFVALALVGTGIAVGNWPARRR